MKHKIRSIHLSEVDGRQFIYLCVSDDEFIRYHVLPVDISEEDEGWLILNMGGSGGGSLRIPQSAPRQAA